MSVSLLLLMLKTERLHANDGLADRALLGVALGEMIMIAFVSPPQEKTIIMMLERTHRNVSS